MKLLEKFIAWFGQTSLYVNCMANLPDGLNNVYLDAIIVLILIIVALIAVYQAIATLIFRIELKKTAAKKERVRLQLEKERLEAERASIRSSEDQRLFFQFMQYMMINQISGMTFEQWKNMNATVSAPAPKEEVEESKPKEEKKNILKKTVEEIKDKVATREEDKTISEENSEESAPEQLEQDPEPVLDEIQIEELLPETELVDEPIEEEVPEIDYPMPVVEKTNPEPEPEKKEFIDIASLLIEKKQEQEASEPIDEGDDAFEQMIGRLTKHKEDLEKEKELNEEISKIKEKNMEALEEQFTSNLRMESEEIQTQLDQMTDEQLAELEKTRKRIEKEEEKKRKAANRKGIFKKKKGGNDDGGEQ